jgi:hypothetical protein
MVFIGSALLEKFAIKRIENIGTCKKKDIRSISGVQYVHCI